MSKDIIIIIVKSKDKILKATGQMTHYICGKSLGMTAISLLKHEVSGTFFKCSRDLAKLLQKWRANEVILM